MNKCKVLVFPAGTEIAFEIRNALKYSKLIELYGANSIPSHAEFVFKNCATNLPFEEDANFINALNELVDRWEIEYVYPAHDSACLTLTREQEKMHAKVVTSALETVEICRSKNRTYDYFKYESFVPQFYRSVREIPSYPIFVKPTVGQGSIGAQKVCSLDELVLLLSTGTEYTFCEYLPGSEYTVDCFTDRHGVLRSCRLRQRERIKTGIAVRSSLIKTDDVVREIAERINSKLSFNGAWFFQLKKNQDGDYRLMEISPRIPGTMGVSRNLGINYPLMTLYNMWGFDVDIIDNDLEITLDRAFISRYQTNLNYKKVYIGFDDTLYIGDKANVAVIAFLYQCANKNIPVTLLTKHINNIFETLEKYKISKYLFSEIVCIDQQDDKCKYINDFNSIMIDDSFAERKSVKEKLGIPVFDLDMIESLIDWRM